MLRNIWLVLFWTTVFVLFYDLAVASVLAQEHNTAPLTPFPSEVADGFKADIEDVYLLIEPIGRRNLQKKLTQKFSNYVAVYSYAHRLRPSKSVEDINTGGHKVLRIPFKLNLLIQKENVPNRLPFENQALIVYSGYIEIEVEGIKLTKLHLGDPKDFEAWLGYRGRINNDITETDLNAELKEITAKDYQEFLNSSPELLQDLVIVQRMIKSGN